MKLSELHRSEETRLREFPIAKEGAFLANAAICPIPTRVGVAMKTLIDKAIQTTIDFDSYEGLYEETRELAAKLLQARSRNVALLGPTSIGLSLVANGLSLESGDNIVYYHGDYPSNAVVWMNLAEKGVELRRVLPKEPGNIGVDDLKELVDSRTRLIALSSAHFISGFRIDLDSIGEWVKKSNALFCVDGIQTVGAIRTHVESLDFLVADAHKWLLGPPAIGLFYVNPDIEDQLKPTLLGWHSVECPEFITPQELIFKSDARRYEAGSPNLTGLVALNASLHLLLDFTIEAVEERVTGYTTHIREQVREKGYTLACSDDSRLSGISSFRKEGVDTQILYNTLADAGIVTSLRATPDGKQWIRFSPHCYNTMDEINRALTLL